MYANQLKQDIGISNKKSDYIQQPKEQPDQVPELVNLYEHLTKENERYSELLNNVIEKIIQIHNEDAGTLPARELMSNNPSNSMTSAMQQQLIILSDNNNKLHQILIRLKNII